MRIAIVGAGRVGTAMGVLLERARHRIVAVSGRGATRDRAASYLPEARFLDQADAARAGELVLIGTPDDLVAETVASLAGAGAIAEGTYVAHVSGVLGLEVLEPVRALGGQRLAIHPLQTIPDVGRGIDRIPGCSVAVAADDEPGYLVAERIADDLGGEPFRLADAMRPLYHSAAVLASNDLVVLSAIATALLKEAGVPDPSHALGVLQRATLDNLAEMGPEKALTGPVVRGDAGTVERNLTALAAHAPDAVAPYTALARSALDLAVRAGRLDPHGRDAVDDVLARWS